MSILTNYKIICYHFLDYKQTKVSIKNDKYKKADAMICEKKIEKRTKFQFHELMAV